MIARLFQARRFSLLASMLDLTGLVAYVAAIAIAGVWLVIPWHMTLAYLSVAVVAVLYRAGDIRALRWLGQG